jgi:hypothetical protein
MEDFEYGRYLVMVLQEACQGTVMKAKVKKDEEVVMLLVTCMDM